MDETKNESESAIADACFQYGIEVVATQKVLVKEKEYDFAPQFEEMTTQLYLLGAIWRFAEDRMASEQAREAAFSTIQKILVSDGAHKKKAQQRIDFLKKMSRVEDGSNALAVSVGYQSESGNGGLVEVLDQHVDDMQVSGDFWRLYERGRKTILYGGLIIAFIVIWFVTLYMPGNSTIAIFAAGVGAAAIFVIPVFLVCLVVYQLKMKKAKNKGP